MITQTKAAMPSGVMAAALAAAVRKARLSSRGRFI